jgi:hypothetical protein
LTLRKSKGIITPYSLVLKDENGEIIEGEKMEGTISSVPHSSSKPTAIGDAHSFKATTSHDTNPSFQGANVQQNIETNKNNDIKTENIFMNKKQIRLTESDLKQIVKESVNKILYEAYGTMPTQDKVSQNVYGGADFDKSAYSNDNEQLIAEYMQKLASGIYNVMGASEWFGYYSEGEILGDSKNPSLKKYSDMIYNKIQEIENIYQQIRRIMTMRLGLQPDTRYDIKHLSLDDEATLQWRDIAGPKAKRKADDYFDQYDKEKIMKRNRDINKGRSFTAV